MSVLPLPFQRGPCTLVEPDARRPPLTFYLSACQVVALACHLDVKRCAVFLKQCHKRYNSGVRLLPAFLGFI
jgi:hypothetical protein